jgi:hypothetical protein
MSLRYVLSRPFRRQKERQTMPRARRSSPIFVRRGAETVARSYNYTYASTFRCGPNVDRPRVVLSALIRVWSSCATASVFLDDNL